MDTTVKLTQREIDLILSALIYLKDMSLAIAAETGGRLGADKETIEQLEDLARRFEEV